MGLTVGTRLGAYETLSAIGATGMGEVYRARDPRLGRDVAIKITFTGPNNWRYSSRVEDKKALATVKVGDRVDITWTDALLVVLRRAEEVAAA
jgi:hypothetical protein